MLTSFRRSAACLAALIFTASAGAAPRSAPLTGNWAGDNFSLRTIKDGAMVQGKCAVGKVDAAIVPGPDGRFTARGYFNPVKPPGYRLSDLTPRDRPAEFSGKVAGEQLELTVRTFAPVSVATYKLQRGKSLKFADCRQA